MPQTLAEPVPVVEIVEVTLEQKAKELVEKYGDKHNLSVEKKRQMFETIKCETANTFNPKIQSHAKYKDGTRERSFGLSQIHLPAHPYISYEQAIDPDFAVEFMAKSFVKGKERWWTCWRNLYL